MINVKNFYDLLNELNVNFYTGVPDSLLKDICNYITDFTPKENNIISTNEGGAIALAMGYNLATSKVPLVYMQNSGFGNSINPLLSLADSQIYGIPMLIMVGWRGEPGVKDEPQHIKQGEITEDLLKVMNIPYTVFSSNTVNTREIMTSAMDLINKNRNPFVILVKKETFEPYFLKSQKPSNFDLNREGAIKKIIDLIESKDIVVATTGKTSREVFEYREQLGVGHEKDFLTVGGMGHANQIALGIAISKPSRKVYCLDGDGAILMHTGAMGIIGSIKPLNFKHIIINNGAHDSVGGQQTIGFETSFRQIAEAFNYTKTFRIEYLDHFNEIFNSFKKAKGPCLLEILVNKGARKNLGRPTISPRDNLKDFKLFLE